MSDSIEIPPDVSWEEARLLVFNELRRSREDLKVAHNKIRRLEDGEREKRIRAGAKGGIIGTLITILIQVIGWAVKIYMTK